MCYGFDIDSEALKICQRNVEEFELSNVEIVELDVREWVKLDDHRFIHMFDTVIMNPPFGTRQQGISDLDTIIYLMINFHFKVKT